MEVMMIRDEPDILVQGSEEVECKGLVFYAAVLQQLIDWSSIPEDSKAYTYNNYCTIVSPMSLHNPNIVCHVCEGGHHVHVRFV